MNPFSSFIGLQEEMLAIQKAQLDAAKKALAMSEQFIGAQKAAQEAAEANIRAWESWLKIWGVGP